MKGMTPSDCKILLKGIIMKKFVVAFMGIVFAISLSACGAEVTRPNKETMSEYNERYATIVDQTVEDINFEYNSNFEAEDVADIAVLDSNYHEVKLESADDYTAFINGTHYRVWFYTAGGNANLYQDVIVTNGWVALEASH
jgi:hypothetical protein